MKLILDPKSPAPLYHQISEALRYRIGTGEIAPGSPVPSVRNAADAWGVNLHTVRKAYGILAEQGLLEIRGALGTRVASSSAVREAGPPSRELAAFLARTVQEAQREFLLSPEELARHVNAFGTPREAVAPKVSVVECSEAQCLGHAEEIQRRWQVAAQSFSLDSKGEPPRGPIIATYFHFNEVRQRWPHRLSDIQFLAIHPDPRLAELAAVTGKRRRCTILLCEFDLAQAESVAADLRVLLATDRFKIETRVVQRANELLDRANARCHLLFTPRVWAGLTQTEQASREAHPVNYVIKNEELTGLGRRFGWRERPQASNVF